MSQSHLPERIAAIVACPHCVGNLAQRAHQLSCGACERTYNVQNEVPVFIPGKAELAAEHTSDAIAPHFEELLKSGAGLILHIGAGGSAHRYPNCVEFEHKIFRHTDVVGDAHQMPFRDGVFDRVFALNVFEHLRDPKRAAGEIFRVLKPGGRIAIHTAFLQALHEEPHHYYNATEYGVREWFSAFEIETVDVTGNFGPGVMLAFLAANILETAKLAGVSSREQMQLSGTSIGEWAEFWASRLDQPPGFPALQGMPQSIQKRIAAGFELVARKPATA